MSNRAAGSPNDATGLPQYCWSRYALRFVEATSSRCATSLGHNVHRVMDLFRLASNSLPLLQFTR